jgi:hypothetical protein
MDANEKKLAAAFAAVTAYIQTEEEALVMPPPSGPSPAALTRATCGACPAGRA